MIEDRVRGRGHARCVGFRLARGGFILSTDADTVVPPTWIDDLLDRFSSQRIVAVSGTARIGDCAALTNGLFNMLQPTLMVLYWVAFGHFWLTGCSFAIRRGSYERCGGFHSDLCEQEDTELARRVRRVGHIAFMRKPVTCSGRRFRQGLFRVILDYIISYVATVMFSRGTVRLPDVR